jgi:hemolysin activation/secretion protein
MGLNASVQVTRALGEWGSSRSTWLYSANATHGFTFPWGHDVLATASIERRPDTSGGDITQVGTQLRYYAPQSLHAAFYGAFAADRIGSAAAPDQLLLGGDNGLRGYPLRYQAGGKRVLLTLEQRAYTDWYPLRLLRVGGAVFYDIGRAWGGANANTVNGGWLSDAGIGLRLALDRTAFANVLHADIAVPLDRAAGIKRVQYIVKTQLTF